MAEKDERFITAYKEGSELTSSGVRMVLIDKWTGVNYLAWKSGYGAGLTPLIDPDGKPVISKTE